MPFILAKLSRSIAKTLLAEGVISRAQAERIWTGAINECRADGPTLTEYKSAAALLERLFRTMIATRSMLHNLVVAAVGFLVGLVGAGLDQLLGVREFHSTLSTVAGSLLICIGFLIRFWATYYFYKNQIRVIATTPQGTLITSGPYRYSRNPLYLGGNVFIFFGAGLLLGSPTALTITALHLPFVDLFIRREEKQLEQRFGEQWVRYKRSVRRWF